MILIIDNYDSFTYNLVDLLAQQTEVQVHRNDEVEADIVEELQPAGILISPGPGRPVDSVVSYPIVQRYRGRIPILGVCLGHQLIGEVLGGEIMHAARPMHGKVSPVRHQGQGLLAGLPQPLSVMRYHSLVIRPGSLPPEVEVTAQTDAGEIMALRHRHQPLWGVQFHPESIGSQGGARLIGNWLDAFAANPDRR